VQRGKNENLRERIVQIFAYCPDFWVPENQRKT